ncbi:hypothetical protein SAMN06265380_104187 [Ruegeria faecimaris]|uniref:Uncharacterized protein n=1 Tax=Ruegeria faecimaris TaxID=686389 RepID=A0A521D2S7_9RHOB|nr:hypothetical protein SAMN06265380_104187 [Ruegeria faecimaris]
MCLGRRDLRMVVNYHNFCAFPFASKDLSEEALKC